MKVLQLVPAMQEGGVEGVVVDLNRLLAENGVEDVVVSRGGKLAARIEADGGRHVNFDLKSKNPLTVPRRVRELRRLIRREDPDLVCTHSRVPAWLFKFANRKLHLRWITYAHGANGVSRYSKVMTEGERTIVPSKFLAEFLKANYPIPDRRLRVIPPAVDLERFDPAKLDREWMAAKRREWGLDGRKVVMSVGRITRLKGYDNLIRAFAALPNRAAAKLVIVGGADADKAELLESLKAQVKAADLESQVVFAGSQSLVPECLALADVVVSANTVKPESFGRSIAEALAMERPVVAKAFGGAAEIIRDGLDGVLVRDGDFTSAIAKALDMDAFTSRAYVRECYSRERMLELTLSAYGFAASPGALPAAAGKLNVTAVVPVFDPEPGLETLVAELSRHFARVTVVDDGSVERREAFNRFAPSVSVLRHSENRGKGRAMKTALEDFVGESGGYVFVDGDGQHRIDDVVAVARRMLETDSVVFGVRDLRFGKVPFRSWWGNAWTAAWVQWLCGFAIPDTQTGLRAVPARLAWELKRLDGERFEFEARWFRWLKSARENVRLVPIRTVYLDRNRASHFRPFRDTLSTQWALWRPLSGRERHNRR